MTNRISPAAAADDDQGGDDIAADPYVRHTTGACRADGCQCLTGATVAMLALDPAADGFEAAVIGIVRELTTDQRHAMVVSVGSTPSHLVAIPTILAAPFGPDPAALVAAAVEVEVDRLAALIRGAVERGTMAADADPAAILAAALARVAPDVERAAAVEVPAVEPTPTRDGVRRRRNISRDWSSVNRATFYTPGRGGRGRVPILVTVGNDGRPKFHATDPAGSREAFSTPTPALAWADGWTRDGERRGWANPFVCLVDADGATLGSRAPEVEATA